jgi:NADH:ubiquinone oxidoreductase subunit H
LTIKNGVFGQFDLAPFLCLLLCLLMAFTLPFASAWVMTTYVNAALPLLDVALASMPLKLCWSHGAPYAL